MGNMTSPQKPNHKAALKEAQELVTEDPIYGIATPQPLRNIKNLAAAYLALHAELKRVRELARAVIKVADRDTDEFNALRAAINKE